MPRIRLLAIGIAASSALALVACGTDTAANNDYVDQVNEAPLDESAAGSLVRSRICGRS